MQVTAKKISEWAGTRVAQGLLPILLRRLIPAVGKPTSIDFPGGDSIASPGWDGVLQAEEASSWFPAGISYWEFGCDAQAKTKADGDYSKRTAETPDADRESSTFVFVSPRKWVKKRTWITEKKEERSWQDVRAYNASDLEQWLEQAPAVALWFGEQLGLVGPGLESPNRRWELWSEQTKQPITLDAMLAGRESAKAKLMKALTGGERTVKVRADSADEAVAFALAALLTGEQPQSLISKTAVITEPEGWRYMEGNPGITVAVTTRHDVAAQKPSREGLSVIVPLALDERSSYKQGSPRSERDSDIKIERPLPEQFEAALVQMGQQPSEAHRCANSTSRSWSVYRRICAENPAIASPPWENNRATCALTTMCLVGAWDGEKEGDRAVVERIANRTYEDLERDLLSLAAEDDPPVLLIGSVWKAKSPLELIHRFGERITGKELDRFFTVVEEVLSTPDPALELPEGERFMASVSGKVRTESEFVIDSVCDSLIKLAYVGPAIRVLKEHSIESRVAFLMRKLLADADAIRWLSLTSVLRELAEAAPDEFLRALESSLADLNQPVSRLLTETQSSGFLGRCWHADLLWGLEVLAWSPEFLARVAMILTQLATVPIKGNWGNTPLNTLVSILRPQFPQTAAPVEQRMQILDRVMDQDQGIAWKMLYELGLRYRGYASQNARPAWRDYDAGVGVARRETQQMYVAIYDHLLKLAQKDPLRTADMLENLDAFPDAHKTRVLDLTESFCEPDVLDMDRALLRTALGKYIGWHQNHDESPPETIETLLERPQSLYERLVPTDPVARHCWLFDNPWCKLPGAPTGDHKETSRRRQRLQMDAIKELLEAGGLLEVERLMETTDKPRIVGEILGKSEVSDDAVIDWICRHETEFQSSDAAPVVQAMSGLFSRMPLERRQAIVEKVVDEANTAEWTAEQIARFLAVCPCDRTTWDIIDNTTPNSTQQYWKTVNPGFVHLPSEDHNHLIRRLLEVNRAHTAFQTTEANVNDVEPDLLFECLDGIIGGDEPKGPSVDEPHVCEAFEVIETAGCFERQEIAGLEVRLYPLLEHSKRGAKALTAELASSPALFAQLICLVFRRKNADAEDAADENQEAAALHSYRILNGFKCVPGTQDDGSVDATALGMWVDEARHLCGKADREGVAEESIGQILAHAPAGTDGIWPCEPVRELLNDPKARDMRHGFAIGTMNKQGATSRGCYDGGDQEREQAEYYRKHEEALQISHPHTAATLAGIASDYERYAHREDNDAQLRIER